VTDNTYDVIVVGAGFGGSSCAGLLAKRGLKVLLAEKNPNAGGKAMSISKNGYTHTPWVVIGAPVEGNLYAKDFKELEVEDLAKLIIPGTQGSHYKTSTGQYVRLPTMPTDSQAMDPNLVFDWLEIPESERENALKFFIELTMMPPEKIDTFHETTFEDWITPYNIPRALYAFLASLIADGLFMGPSDCLDAAEMIASLQDMFLRNGGVFCEGGWGKLAEAYCEAVRRNGGDVLMSTRVDEISVEDGKVTGIVTSEGTFKSSIVISNAGLQPTILKLVGEAHFDKSYVNYVKDLVPSWALLGYRYFLSKPITDAPYGVLFSDDSPWSLERFNKARVGEASREGVVYFEVPSNYDPKAAPEGKQIFMTGSFCPADPNLSKEEYKAWANAGEETLFKAFPELEAVIEDKHLYTTRHVSNLTRDSVVPGAGGETIGLGQFVGQCGPTKPSIKAPIRGLYIVGADAGGTGVGTQQAIESGMNVAEVVQRYQQMKKANP
jgi:phytoene dehydrogenase-like protein